MQHVFWVYEGALAGRTGPRAEPWDISELQAGGIDLILSVASDLFPPQDAVRVGMSRTCVPMPDLAPPDEYSARVCTAVLPLAFEIVRSNIDAGRKVLVHCAAGCDRTGLVLSHYIAWREGIGPAEAIARLRTVRPEALSTRGWEQMALRVLPEVLGKDA